METSLSPRSAPEVGCFAVVDVTAVAIGVDAVPLPRGVRCRRGPTTMNPSIERWLRTMGDFPLTPQQQEPEVRLRLVMLQPPREERAAPDYDPNGPVGRRARRASRRGSTSIFGGRACCGRTADSIQRKIDGHHVRVPHTEVCATCGAVWQAAVDLGGALGG